MNTFDSGSKEEVGDDILTRKIVSYPPENESDGLTFFNIKMQNSLAYSAF